MVKRRDEFEDEVLAGQVPEYQEPIERAVEVQEPESSLGKKLSINPGGRQTLDNEGFDEFERKVGATKLGESLAESGEARAGWIPVDRRLMGERSYYYPEDWTFLIRPATVEAVRNWSMLDEQNGNSIDDVFNEMLKYCLTIRTSTGNKPWQEINSWDRLFFILLIREYTFVHGENNVEYYEDCDACDKPVKFTVESQALMYELPDEDIKQYFDQYSRTWIIDPNAFGVESPSEITLYVPTVERDANIKAWLISEYQENEKKKFDPVFIKFLPWLTPKISKDVSAAKMQIRKAEMTFKSWNTEMFTFMNDVIRNIAVTPQTTISAICPECGEEVVVKLRFPDGVGALFNVVNRRTKFGSK